MNWVFVLNGKASFAEHARGAARGEDPDILLGEALSQVEQTGLVVDGEDGDLLGSHCDETGGGS